MGGLKKRKLGFGLGYRVGFRYTSTHPPSALLLWCVHAPCRHGISNLSKDQNVEGLCAAVGHAAALNPGPVKGPQHQDDEQMRHKEAAPHNELALQ
jgi:hypothetical protein